MIGVRRTMDKTKASGTAREAAAPDGVVDQARAGALVLAAAMHMPCGLAVYDADDRLVFVNGRYVEDLGFPPSIVRPGIPFRRIAELSVALGRFPGETVDSVVAERRRRILAGGSFGSEEGHSDGRQVRLSHVVLPGGGWMTTTEDVTEERRAQERVVHMAHHDELTGLGNRRMLDRRFEEGRRRRHLEALLQIDLDGLRSVNELYGQSTGDALLRAAAARMLDCLRDTDFVGRFGGDEFVVLLSGTERHDGLDRIALRLLRSLAKPFAIGDFDIDIGASIGSARCHPADLGLDALMKRADDALRRAKAGGRGRHVTFERTGQTSRAIA